MSNESNVNGIGIINFLKHKTFLITGSTGFIAKVFVEKLLREVPELEKIYLLMRAKNEEAAMQRLQSEIIDCEVFKRLEDEHGQAYEKFMKSKLVPVVGNVCDSCLGMDVEIARHIADQIDVIINTAGNTRWHERYDVILDVNVRGVSRLVDYAMNCKNLLLLLHVSTAYVAREDVEVIMEKPIIMEESTAEEQNLNFNVPSTPDIEAELKMVEEIASNIPNNNLPMEMVKLGFRRAKIYGWPSPYPSTKAMGEIVLTKLRNELPIVIIRPSLAESSFRDPFPGWIEGYKVMDPLILSYGKGELQEIFADPMAILDVVPIDQVINAMIAATCNHGIIGQRGTYIYHVTSSMVNPLLSQTLFKYCYNYFKLHPLKTSRGEAIKVKDIEYYSSFEEYILVGLDAKPSNEKQYSKLIRMAVIYGVVMFDKSRFNNKNTQDLFEKMSLEEKKIFDFDVKHIDWEDYFMNIHFSGLRKYILKEKFPYAKL